MTPPDQGEWLSLLGDLVLHLAEGLGCSISLLPGEGEGPLSTDVTVACSGLDQASFLAVKGALLAELADSIIPLRIGIALVEAAEAGCIEEPG